MDSCSDRLPPNIECNPNYDAPKVAPPYDTVQITVFSEPISKERAFYEGAKLEPCFTLPALWLLSLAEKTPEFEACGHKLALRNIRFWVRHAKTYPKTLSLCTCFGEEIAKHLPLFEYSQYRITHRFDWFEFLRVDERGVYTFKLLQKNG